MKKLKTTKTKTKIKVAHHFEIKLHLKVNFQSMLLADMYFVDSSENMPWLEVMYWCS